MTAADTVAVSPDGCKCFPVPIYLSPKIVSFGLAECLAHSNRLPLPQLISLISAVSGVYCN